MIGVWDLIESCIVQVAFKQTDMAQNKYTNTVQINKCNERLINSHNTFIDSVLTEKAYMYLLSTHIIVIYIYMCVFLLGFFTRGGKMIGPPCCGEGECLQLRHLVLTHTGQLSSSLTLCSERTRIDRWSPGQQVGSLSPLSTDLNIPVVQRPMFEPASSWISRLM